MSGDLTDDEIAKLGYKRTSRGWSPLDTAEEHERTGLTAKQWRRFPFVTVRGWDAIPDRSAKLFALAASLGKMMHVNKTFERIRHQDEALCVIVRDWHRDRALERLRHADEDKLRPWRRALEDWQSVGMAHTCSKAEVALFFEPLQNCVACETAISGGSNRQNRRVVRQNRRESVPTAGDALRDGKGDEAVGS